MSETAAAEAPATGAEGTAGVEPQQTEQKPTETVDHWKSMARHWEKQSKANSEAADKLAKLEDSQKSEAQRAADAKAKAESEIAGIPAKVADSLREHLVKVHKIDAEDAELFLTANDPDLLIKQVNRLIGQAEKGRKKNHVPREGQTTTRPEDEMRSFTQQVFGRE